MKDMAIMAFFWLEFASSIFYFLSTLKLCLSLEFKHVSNKQHLAGCGYFCHFIVRY